jgi:hypothetical protein
MLIQRKTNMKTLPKTLLALSVASFAASLTGPGIAVWFGILKPIAALSFMVAFIVHVVSSLDPEQYEADQSLRNELMHQSTTPGRTSYASPTSRPALPIHAKAAA